jgi:hypothetical protein
VLNSIGAAIPYSGISVFVYHVIRHRHAGTTAIFSPSWHGGRLLAVVPNVLSNFIATEVALAQMLFYYWGS